MRIRKSYVRGKQLFLELAEEDNSYLGTFIIRDTELANAIRHYRIEDLRLKFEIQSGD